MKLVEKIKADQIEARKKKSLVASALLTTLLGDINKIGKDDGNRETIDTEAVAVIKKFLKSVDETLKYLGDGNPEATEVANTEKSILESYLPKQMSKEEIKIAVESLFQPGETMNKGNMMSRLKQNYAGQYDGKIAALAVDELLQ